MPVETSGTLVQEIQLADGRVKRDGDLSIAIDAFNYELNGTRQTYGGGVGQAVTDDDTSFVFLDVVGNLVVQTSGWSGATEIRLARVVAVGGLISQIVNERSVLCATSQSGGFLTCRWFNAVELRSPVNADWAQNALAPVGADDDANAVNVRAFDDTVEEGVGLEVYVPAGAASMRLRFVSRAATAPPSAKAVALNLYERGFPGAVDAWSAPIQLTNVDVPTSENWLYDEQIDTLANWGLVAGQVHQLEITRDAADAADTLAGDWRLLYLAVEFT